MAKTKAELVFSEAAEASIISIGHYTEQNWGRNQRNEYLAKLFSSFAEICKSPESGKRRDNILESLRSTNVGKHVVYYLFKKNKVFIVDVLHEKMESSLYLSLSE